MTGAEVITADPNSLTLEVQTMVLVEAAVDPFFQALLSVVMSLSTLQQ